MFQRADKCLTIKNHLKKKSPYPISLHGMLQLNTCAFWSHCWWLTVKLGHLFTQLDLSKDSLELGLIDTCDEPAVNIGVQLTERRLKDLKRHKGVVLQSQNSLPNFWNCTILWRPSSLQEEMGLTLKLGTVCILVHIKVDDNEML